MIRPDPLQAVQSLLLSVNSRYLMPLFSLKMFLTIFFSVVVKEP